MSFYLPALLSIGFREHNFSVSVLQFFQLQYNELYYSPIGKVGDVC